MSCLFNVAASAMPGLALLAIAALGCGDELGDCDEAAAQEVVYGRNGLVATKGQALLHDTCGNAAFCHSNGAAGDTRFGAPADMDFDMLPRPIGWPDVMAHRDEIWSAVLDGVMPPAGSDTTLGDGDWRFDVERREGGDELAKLATTEGKAALRNWLACSAPVVAETQAPAWAMPSADAGADGLADWSEIFEQVIRPSCATAGCHDAPTAGGLVMVYECEAYAQLLESGTCEGRARLIPGSGNSYLLDKLESSAPACGSRMPPLGPLPAGVLADVRAWVEAGAPAQNCESP